MDNINFHKTSKVRVLIEEAGCRILFLPTYSPDLNTIENHWYRVKNAIRKFIPQFRHWSLAFSYVL
jgi:transposase